MFKSTLNYLFKTKQFLDEPEIDSSSAVENIPAIKISDEIKAKGIELYKGRTGKDIALQEYPTEVQLETIETLQTNLNSDIELINEKIRTRIIELRTKLEECKDNVQQALIAEKKLVGETYTAIVPINSNYTSKATTATVEDEVIFGTGYISEKESSQVLNLDTVHIIGEEDTEFKISNNNNSYPLILSVEKNTYNTYNQLGIVLPTITQSGILYVKFENVEAISILDIEGYEIVSKHISNTVKFPVDSSSKRFSIRFLDNDRRDIKINSLYFTEAIYNDETVFETLPFAINKQLSYLTVESCDNYASTEVDISYEISINGEDYEEYRPSGKLKNKLIQSIIKTDKYGYNEPIVLDMPEQSEGVFKFYPENPVIQNSKLKAFSLKLNEDVLSLESFINDYNDTYSINIVTKEFFTFYVNENSYVVLDGIRYNYDDLEDGELLITKGLHKLEIKKSEWKELIDLTKYELVFVGSDYIEVIERETGEKVRVDFYFNPKEMQYNSFYLQLWINEVDIYLYEEQIKRKYSDNYVEYFYKDNPYKTYVLNESPSRFVETIQIRATMKSINKTVCPYISKIIVRGI